MLRKIIGGIAAWHGEREPGGQVPGFHKSCGRSVKQDGRPICSLFDAVRTLASLGLHRIQRQPHLLSDRAAQESPNAVVLPTGYPCDITDRGAILLTEQVQDDGRFRDAVGFRRLGRVRSLASDFGFALLHFRF